MPMPDQRYPKPAHRPTRASTQHRCATRRFILFVMEALTLVCMLAAVCVLGPSTGGASPSHTTKATDHQHLSRGLAIINRVRLTLTNTCILRASDPFLGARLQFSLTTPSDRRLASWSLVNRTVTASRHVIGNRTLEPAFAHELAHVWQDLTYSQFPMGSMARFNAALRATPGDDTQRFLVDYLVDGEEEALHAMLERQLVSEGHATQVEHAYRNHIGVTEGAYLGALQAASCLQLTANTPPRSRSSAFVARAIRADRLCYDAGALTPRRFWPALLSDAAFRQRALEPVIARVIDVAKTSRPLSADDKRAIATHWHDLPDPP